MTTKTRTKAAARCEECGSAFVVWVLPDGGIRPIGIDGGCSCGGSGFRVLSEDRSRSSGSRG
jgi:hypothetical protein